MFPTGLTQYEVLAHRLPQVESTWGLRKLKSERARLNLSDIAAQ